MSYGSTISVDSGPDEFAESGEPSRLQIHCNCRAVPLLYVPYCCQLLSPLRLCRSQQLEMWKESKPLSPLHFVSPSSLLEEESSLALSVH